MRELGDDNPLRSRYVVVQRSYETLPGPTLSVKSFDPLSNTNAYTQSSQIVTNSGSNVPSIVGSVVVEYEDIDYIHSKKSIKDYSTLVNVTWTEYQTIAFTYPALLVVQSGNLFTPDDVLSFRLARSLRVQSEITYTIRTTPDTTTRVVTFIPVTITSDAGTFTNVMHNVVNTTIRGVAFTPEQSLQNLSSESSYTTPYPSTSYAFGANLVIENNSTRIKGYGGLYLNKIVTVKLN